MSIRALATGTYNVRGVLIETLRFIHFRSDVKQASLHRNVSNGPVSTYEERIDLPAQGPRDSAAGTGGVGTQTGDLYPVVQY